MTAREAALIAWSAFLCVSASFLRSACVRVRARGLGLGLGFG